MKTIGLIGGMSWESSAEYYRIINETIKDELGGYHSAKSIMYSVDFEEIEKLVHAEKWKEIAKLMIDAAKKLENGGADFIVICSNTIHKVSGEIGSNIKIPLLHIADVTAENIISLGLKKVGLLGTKFTMKDSFLKNRLTRKRKFDISIPNDKDCDVTDDIIFNELCLGMRKEKSKKAVIKIVEKLIRNGAQGIVLGCTELPMLVNQKDCNVPLFDTTKIHAKAAVDYALKE